MASSSTNLTWCIVQLGEDMNWWVSEITDKVHWDVDGLSILDPKQLTHMLDLIDPLQEYGLDTTLVENAFFKFKIEKDLGKGQVQLINTTEPLLSSDEKLFALPDLIDDEKSAFADFLSHITALRVKMLNDTMEFEQMLTIDDLEEELREAENNRMIEGTHLHIFDEITSILEYIPAGYQSDDEEGGYRDEEDSIPDEEIPNFEEESIEEDDTMRWEDEDEEETDDEDSDDEEEDLEDDDE
jgi:hypothetical protein